MTTLNPPQQQSPEPLQVYQYKQPVSWGSIISRLGPLLGLVAVVSLFSVLQHDRFFRVSNFELILRQTAVVGTGALGMTLIIISGGIDLSVGSMVALVTVTISLLLSHQTTNPNTGVVGWTHGVSPWLAALAGVAVATLCGFISGFLITRLKLVPFIITLGMMSALRGTAKGIADNGTITLSDDFSNTALSKLLQPISDAHLLLLTPGAWLMLLLAILTAAMLRYTRFGRHIFAIGSNEQTARLCGVPVERTKLLIYCLGAALTGIAGVLHFSYLGIGDPTTAVGMELDIIAAVVIGGASLSGGQGTILGSVVGALIMTVVANGCTKMNWDNWVQEIVTGIIIILAVALDQLRHREGS